MCVLGTCMCVHAWSRVECAVRDVRYVLCGACCAVRAMCGV
jgi:hypothetical protein